MSDDQNSGGFGLRLFKSSTEARAQDVAPRSNNSIYDIYGDSSPSSQLTGISSPSTQPAMPQGDSLYNMYEESPLVPTPQPSAKPAEEQSNFGRGWDVSGKQLKQTAYGTAALIGDTIGATGVKEWGLKGFKDAEKEVQAISKESDSFTNAMQSGELGKWFTYSSGYLLGQVAELGAASLAGAAIGSSVAPGAGTAAGAVTGAIEKGAVQTGVKAMVAKMIDKEATRLAAEGMAKEVAAETAMKSVYRTIGATTANTFLNATQELGSIYGDAVEQAAKSGQEYSLGKVWLSGVMATAVDSWADSKAVGNLMDAFKGGKGIGGVAVEAFKGGFREGMTEGVQTAIERWGADKDLASQEAFKEYIDSAAVGVLGGSIAGGSAAGVKRMLEPSEPLPGKPDTQGQQTSGFTDTGVTNLPSDTNGRSAVQPDEMLMPMPQFRSTLANVGYVASIYQDADAAQKQKIDMAIDRAGLRDEFNAAFKDGQAMADGQKLLTENPEERGLFMAALDKYATTMPRQGNFKTAPAKPVSEEQRLDEINQANEQQYGAAVNAEPETNVPAYEQNINLSVEENAAGELLHAIDNGGVPLNPARIRVVAEGLGLEVSKSAKPEETIARIREAFSRAGAVNEEAQTFADEQAQEVSQSTDDQQTLATVLSQKNKARNKPELKPEDIEIVQLPQAITEIGNMFGIELVGFKAKGGVNTRGMSSRSSNKIYINAATQGNVDMRFILGHEVWHQLERRNPEMAALLADEVVAYVKASRREAYAKQITSLGYSPDKVTSEMAGDILGILFTEENFWQQVGQKNPGLLDQVLEVINKIIASITTKVKRNDFGRANGLKEAITDLETVRDLLSSITADLAQKDTELSKAGFDFMEQDDAVQEVRTLLLEGKFEKARKLFITEKVWGRSGKTLSFNQVVNEIRANLPEPTDKEEVKQEVKQEPKQTKPVEVKQTELVSADNKSPSNILLDAARLELMSSRMRNSGVSSSVKTILTSVDRILGFNSKGELERNKDGSLVSESVTDSDLETAHELLARARDIVDQTVTEERQAFEDAKAKRDAERAEADAREAAGLPTPGAEQKTIEQYVLETQKPARKQQQVDEEQDFGSMRQVNSVMSDKQREKLRSRLPNAVSGMISALTQVQRNKVLEMLSDSTDEELSKLADFTMKYRASDNKSAVAEWLRGMKPVDRAIALVRLSEMSEVKFQQLSNSLENPLRSQPVQMRLALQQDSRYVKVKAAVDAVMNMTHSAPEYRRTIAKMWEAVANIDAALSQGNYLKDGQKVFKAVEQPDENSYLWSDEQGFGIPKNLPQEKLLSLRRSIMEDIENIRVENQRGLVSLFKNNLDRVDYNLSLVRTKALQEGIPMEIVDSAYMPARQSIVKMMQDKRSRNKDEAPQVAEEAAPREVFQSDMFPAEKSDMEAMHLAFGLVSDFKSKKITETQFDGLVRDALYEGDFNHSQIVQAVRAFSMDPTHNLLNIRSQLAGRTRLGDFMRDNNYSEAARIEWLTSMHKLVKAIPTMLETKSFTDAERIAYAAFIRPRNALKEAFKTDLVEVDPRAAFPNMLWSKYGLAEMRDLNLITDANERTAVQSMYGDPVESWFQQLAYALRRRPSLANSIFDAEEGILPTDKEAFDQWIAKKKRANEREAVIVAKMPHFTELRNIDGINPELDSVPGYDFVPSAKEQGNQIEDLSSGQLLKVLQSPADFNQAGNTQEAVVSSVQNPTRVAPSEYEQIYVRIANAELNDLPVVQASIQRLIAIRSGNFDPETGEILTDAEADAEIAETVRQVLEMHMEEDEKGLESESGVDEEGIGFAPSAFTEEESNTEAAQSTEELVISSKTPRTRVPTSLEGGPEYEFMDDAYDFEQGPWKGLPTMAVLADEIGKLDLPVRVTLLEHAGQLPEPLRSKVMQRIGQNLGAKGMYHDGQVYVFGSQILGPNDLKFTLFHEIYGHLGLRSFLGEKFDSFLESAYRTSNEVKMLADQIMQQKAIGKLEAVDEALAGMAATDYKSTPFQQWMGKVIEGLRARGFDTVADWFAKTTGAEIAFTLQQAKEAVRNGRMIMSGSPEEFRLAEQTLPYEMFAIAKGNTRAYVRFNPVTNTWAAFIANGSDIRDKAGYTSLVFNTYEEAYKAIETKGKVERRTRSGMYIDDKIPQDLVKIPDFKNVSAWESFKRAFITRVQNEYHPVFQVVEHLRKMGRINEQIDVKQALMLYERRTGASVEFFRQHHVEPLLKMVAEASKLGADINIINRYITARHAAERNAVVAKVNPSMQDGGSGLSTRDAAQILADVAAQPYARVLEDIGARLDTISQEKLQYMLAHGMITKSAFEKMSAYKHYVNLSGVVGVDEEFDDPGMLAGGNKFNAQKGAEKRAFGRGEGNEAPDVLARTILSAEAQIIRANKNMVAQRILAMLEVNQDPNFATVNKQSFKRQVNPVTGEVEFVPDTNYMANKNVMVAKVRGIPVTIEFADNTPGSFADAIHGMVLPPQATPIMAKLGEINQFMGQMLTTWNPAWIAVNFVRDIQTMYFNAATDGRITKAHAKAMLKTIPKAIATALYRYNPNLPIKPDPEMLRIYDEMKVEGGLTSFVNRHGLEDQVGQINAALYGKTRMQKIQGLFDFMEHLTIPMEVAPRLAAYKVMRDAGFTRADSAVFSGEITINFNMRGSMKELRQLYLFFNPAVQGTAKMVDLAKNNPGKMAQYAIAFAAVGAFANLIARAASGDDEDGINKMDKLPVYKRATSIVLWANGPAIPIPYGWNAFYATGHFMMDSLLGVQPLSVSAKRAAVSTFEAFSPLGTAGLDSKDFVTAAAKGIAPTAALPIVEYMANENRYGAPIRQTQSPFDLAEKPDAQSYFRSVSPISKGLTDTLTEMTGGSKFHKGGIDVNPSVIDFVIASYLPGFANEAYKGASMAVRAAKGETLKEAPLPLLGRFEARVPEGYDAGAFRRAATLVETAHKEWKMDHSARDRLREEYPSIGAAHAIISSTQQQIREIHQQMDRMERRPEMDQRVLVERENRLREREKAIYQKAVKRLSNLGGKYKEAIIEAQ